MKKHSLMALAAVCVLALAAPVHAQNVDPTGTWNLTFNTEQGPIGAQMVVTRQGDAYGGSIASELGEAAIEAAVKGNAITVGFTMTMQGGGDLGVTLNATITGDEIKGTFDAGGNGGGDFLGKRAPKDQAAAEGGAAKLDLTGAWNVQVTTDTISASPMVTLKQDGDKLTGEYESAQYGKFPLTGTVTGNKVEFGFSMAIEGNSIDVAFSGTAEGDGMKGSVSYGDFASGSFTATRKK